MKRVLAAMMVVLLVLAWNLAPQWHAVLLAAWLAAWWFYTGIALGGLANIWLHNLTGGKWGEVIREPLLLASRKLWLAPLLFLPVLLGMHELYPWAGSAATGMARWSGELAAPAFKNAWLEPRFFILRSAGYLLLWWLLAWMMRNPARQRSRPFAALALILYGVSVSLASVDWIMSLMPLWYSSVFGWLLGTGQMLAGMALAALCAARARPASPQLLADLGNLLMMYVLTWAYLAFTQFLIIWAADLPHEIAWYLPRSRPAWLVVSGLLALFHFFVPMLVLLFRRAKRSAWVMARLAVLLLAMHLLDIWWLILPSVAAGQPAWLWAAPLALLAMSALLLPFFQGKASAAARKPRHA